MATTISKELFNAIRSDIVNGEFSHLDSDNIKFYANATISVTAKINKFYDCKFFAVKVTGAEGKEFDLAEEQAEELYNALEDDLQDREEDARSEAEHIKHLWRTAYA